MRINKQILAGILALSMIPSFSTYADAAYAAPADLVEAAARVALTGITSAAMDSAISTMKGKISITDDKVSYNGTEIGYWYSDASEYIYTDDTRSETILAPSDTDSWEISPDFLEVIMNDVNSNLVDNITPTLNNWSKIVGKHDVKLGDITIPANNWVELSEGEEVDLTSQFGYTLNCFSSDSSSYPFITYAIDTSGALFIGTSYGILTAGQWSPYAITWWEANASMARAERGFWSDVCTTSTSSNFTQVFLPYHQVGSLKASVYWHTDTELTPVINMYSGGGAFLGTSLRFGGQLKKYNDVTQAIDPAKIRSYGIASLPRYGNGAIAFASGDTFAKFFTTTPVISPKQVVGNTVLKRNISKLASLEATDTVVVTPTGWYVNGTTPISEYMGEQVLTAPDTSAEMQGIVDVDALNFRVILPTTLPMRSDPMGNVTTATNAKIKNEGNAPVKISDLTIEADPNGGWTLVDRPSTTRGANEFSFNISLNVDDVIAANDELPFTYEVKLSPPEEDVTSIELVTVTATFDWA